MFVKSTSNIPFPNLKFDQAFLEGYKNEAKIRHNTKIPWRKE